MTRILLLSLILVGCQRTPDLTFSGQENRFRTTEKNAFKGAAAIENSFVRIGSDIVAFFDPNATGAMMRTTLGGQYPQTVLERDARFSYVIADEGKLLNFVTISGKIHRMESIDGGLSWSVPKEIQAAPMVQWNPGVVKLSGTWHMLVEASETGDGPFQGDVGCYHYTSSDGDSWTSHGRVIDKCGNPFLAATSRGLMVIHGDLTTGVWQTTASTFDGSDWETHRNAFLIHSPGVHVCDPHAIEDSGRVILSVSVDQNSITLTEAVDSFEDMHRRLVSYGATGTF